MPVPLRLLKSGEYEVERKLGEGAMGAVYLGRQTQTGSQVAIKHRLKGDADRFARECRLLCDASYRTEPADGHVVRGIEVFSEAGDDYLVMEFVDGVNLTDKRFQRLPLRKALKFVDSILSGLSFLHRIGCIHRDLKPANLIFPRLQSKSHIVIVDLGIAYVADGAPQTRWGVGTLLYSAPEYLIGSRDIGPWSDLYSVGVILFELLTGVSPFYHLHCEPMKCPADFKRLVDINLRADGPDLCTLCDYLPSSIERLVASAMSKDRTKRPQDVSAFRAEFMPLLTRLDAVHAGIKRLPEFRELLVSQLQKSKADMASLNTMLHAQQLANGIQQILRKSRFLEQFCENILMASSREVAVAYSLLNDCVAGLQDGVNDLLSSASDSTNAGLAVRRRLREFEQIIWKLVRVECLLRPFEITLG